MTGAVLAIEHEDPMAEHREAIKEKGEVKEATTPH